MPPGNWEEDGPVVEDGEGVLPESQKGQRGHWAGSYAPSHVDACIV